MVCKFCSRNGVHSSYVELYMAVVVKIDYPRRNHKYVALLLLNISSTSRYTKRLQSIIEQVLHYCKLLGLALCGQCFHGIITMQ